MILLKGPEEIALIRHAAQIVAEVLEEVAKAAIPDVTTEELDALAEELTLRRGAKPAFKGYKPGKQAAYPKSLCVSVNDEIVHGIPSKRKLKAGDIVGLDYGVVYEGYYADAAKTVAVGPISLNAARLIEVTQRALYAGIEQARAGNRVSDISKAIQQVVESAGFSVVEEFAGHGIGRSLHEEPQIPNFYRPGMANPRLQEGMVLAIEPMVNEGSPRLKILSDGWTAVTADGKLSAHFEHSVVVTKDGPVILSQL